MTSIFVNNVPQDLEVTPATWGDLLDRLDAQAAQEGVIVSAARFDGVDEPSFREPALVQRALEETARIEVETAAPDAFLRQCLQEAIAPLEESARTAAALGAQFRERDVADGHMTLVALAADLEALTTMIGLLDGQYGLDAADLPPDRMPAAQHLEALNAVLVSMIGAQESQDWLTVADILEYDLEPLIRRWVDLLTAVTEPA